MEGLSGLELKNYDLWSLNPLLLWVWAMLKP